MSASGLTGASRGWTSIRRCSGWPGSRARACEFVRGSALALPFDDACLRRRAVPARAAVLPQSRGGAGPDAPRPRRRRPARPERVRPDRAQPGHACPGPGARSPPRDGRVTDQARRARARPTPTWWRGSCTAAGFHDITITTETKLVRFPSTSEWVQIQLTATPLASLLAERLGAAAHDREDHRRRRGGAAALRGQRRARVPAGGARPPRARLGPAPRSPGLGSSGRRARRG